jgi:hypothetical protein
LFEHALERARDNLWRRSGGKFEKPVVGVYVSPWHDSYDSSRLFLYDLIWHLEVDGEHVAAVPTRHTLIVTGSEDYGGLELYENRRITGPASPLRNKMDSCAEKIVWLGKERS